MTEEPVSGTVDLVGVSVSGVGADVQGRATTYPVATHTVLTGAATTARPARHRAPPASGDQSPGATHRLPDARTAGGQRTGRDGSCRARADRYRVGWRRLVYPAVLVAAAAGLFVAGYDPRDVVAGIELLGGALLVAALARLVLSPRAAGLLVSRQRLVDVLAFAVLGVGLLVIGLVLPPS